MLLTLVTSDTEKVAPVRPHIHYVYWNTNSEAGSHNSSGHTQTAADSPPYRRCLVTTHYCPSLYLQPLNKHRISGISDFCREKVRVRRLCVHLCQHLRNALLVTSTTNCQNYSATCICPQTLARYTSESPTTVRRHWSKHSQSSQPHTLFL
jgi:hypothetical protein